MRPVLMFCCAAFLVTGVVISLNARKVQSQQPGDYRLVVPNLVRSPEPTPTNGLVRCTVDYVIDGDTIEVDDCPDAGRVRLLHIDTPEVYPEAECFGTEASEYTRDALSGRTVELERDVRDTDRFGRYLRYVWLDGELFNERVVRDGYATLFVFPADTKYQSRVETAQSEAQSANRGLWAACP